MFEKLLTRYNVITLTALVTFISCLLAGILLVLFDLIFKGEILIVDIIIAVLIAFIVAPVVTHGFISLSGELHNTKTELERLATHDYLTGILNRRAFLEKATHELQRDIRYQRPLTILLLDIDHFKNINDRFGHAAGDAVLTEFTRCCQGELRECDIFARYGGEEFIALLPESDIDSARNVAERLCKRAKSCRTMHDGNEIEITVSIGTVSVTPGELKNAPATLDALLVAADRAMYEAKNNGRNQFISRAIDI